MGDKGRPKLLYQWKPDGTGKRGSPKTTYKQNNGGIAEETLDRRGGGS